MFGSDISIDLGTSTMLVYIKGRGIILNEPTVIAVNTKTDEVMSVGKEALEMLGRTPPYIQAVRPLRDGVISNFTLTQEMIRGLIKKVLRRVPGGRPRIMMCVPSGITDVEQRAVIESAREVGARDVYVIEEPVAAALGCGRDISKPRGTMVIDIGGGTTDIAVMALGGVLSSRSIKIAGDEFTEEIVRFLRRDMNLHIGPRTAEDLKCTVGCVTMRDKEVICEAKGISSITGIPKKVMVSSHDVYTIFDELVYNITERAREVLEEVPPDIHADIIDDGIVMTGGGALIYGLDKRIENEIGVRVVLAENITECVVRGSGIALDWIDRVKDPTHVFHKKAYIHE
ncbi:MAG: rod shape-determining protein [Clostridia bacterium]|nr:rod shape-determining protein [Clostridia bacterium]